VEHKIKCRNCGKNDEHWKGHQEKPTHAECLDCGKCRICGNDIEEKCSRKENSGGDSSSLPNYCRCDDIEEDVPCGYCIRKKRSDPEDVEQVSRVQNNLPTAAIVTKTDLDYGCVVDPSYDVRFEEGDELVRRSDVEERDQKIIEAIDEIRKECNMFSDGSIHSKLLALREEIAGVEKKTNGGDK